MKGAAWIRRSHGPLWLERAVDPARLPWLRVDWHVLGIALSLLAIGMLFVHGMSSADRVHERGEIEFSSHLKKALVALPALGLGLCLRARWLRRHAWLVFAVCIVLLLLVPVLGEERNNAKRWIPLPMGFDLQPSELAKPGFVIALARLLYTRRMAKLGDWLRAGLLTLVPMGLVMAQPDLGTALTLCPVALGMVYLAGARGRAILRVVVLGLACGWLAWRLELVRPYQVERIDTWLGSWSAGELIQGRNGPPFHAYHARVAIGNGGWFGQGLSQGVANEAAHRPERESDSVFAVVAEEAGFLGTTGVIVLYTLMIVLLLHSASGVRERFSRLVVGGLALVFAAHFFINIGVNLGLVPLTGLPLPFFSTGGSSLLASFFSLGVALGLAAQSEPTLDADAFRD